MRLTLLAGVASMLALAAPASALTIVFNDIGGVTSSPADRGFKVAARFWERIMTNDVTVNIDIGFSELDPGVLGGASSRLFVVDTQGFQGQLRATGTSTLDAQVASATGLPPLDADGALVVTTPGYVDTVNRLGIDNSYGVVDDDGSFNNFVIAGSSANLKAAGYFLPEGADAEIQFSSIFDFDFDPTDGIGLDQFDFIGVAIHEIGHALGFLSGADDYDALGCPDGPACEDFSDYDVNDDYWGYALDLFRYSAPGELNWRPNVDAYFSIDGGATEFNGNSNFSTGNFHGDGWQASHWKQNGTCAGLIGIMNPYICDGFNSVITGADLAAFDAIGWNLNVDPLLNPNFAIDTATFAASVPEPANWAMLITGFGLIGATLRHRRRRPTTA